MDTNYWGFRTFLKKYYPDFLYVFESKYNIYPGLDDKEKEENLWKYINKLSHYLKLWIQSIRIRDVQVKTNLINPKNKDMYINFNYTGVLENTYKIDKSNIIHIHGSLKKYDNGLVIGHGNLERIKEIRKKKK